VLLNLLFIGVYICYKEVSHDKILLFINSEIMQDVIRSNRKASGAGGGTDWRILLVDQLSMRMVSACCKMHEIASEGITCKLIALLM
jgi:hypothetical protein